MPRSAVYVSNLDDSPMQQTHHHALSVTSPATPACASHSSSVSADAATAVTQGAHVSHNIPQSVKGAPEHLRQVIRKRQNSESAKRSRQRRKIATKAFYERFDDQCKRLEALESKVAVLAEMVRIKRQAEAEAAEHAQQAPPQAHTAVHAVQSASGGPGGPSPEASHVQGHSNPTEGHMNGHSYSLTTPVASLPSLLPGSISIGEHRSAGDGPEAVADASAIDVQMEGTTRQTIFTADGDDMSVEKSEIEERKRSDTRATYDGVSRRAGSVSAEHDGRTGTTEENESVECEYLAPARLKAQRALEMSIAGTGVATTATSKTMAGLALPEAVVHTNSRAAVGGAREGVGGGSASASGGGGRGRGSSNTGEGEKPRGGEQGLVGMEDKRAANGAEEGMGGTGAEEFRGLLPRSFGFEPDPDLDDLLSRCIDTPRLFPA